MCSRVTTRLSHLSLFSSLTLGVLTLASSPAQAQDPITTNLSALSTPLQTPQDPSLVAFVDRAVTTSTGTFSYQIYTPAHLDPKRPAPVILFLHGSGERGDDNRAQTKNGIRLLIAQSGERFPCVVVCPQCRPNLSWEDDSMQEMALAALDQSLKEFHGDPHRVYLTGVSMGGYGTWDLASKYPERWAAIAPCCGGISGDSAQDAQPGDKYLSVARRVKELPIWIFHGTDDKTVSVDESRQMVAVLYNLDTLDTLELAQSLPKIKSRKKPRIPLRLKYSEYPGVGHNSWDYAYKEPQLLSWFLAQKQPTTAKK